MNIDNLPKIRNESAYDNPSWAMGWNDCRAEMLNRIYAKPKESVAQRITEQDARSIAVHCLSLVDGFNIESATTFVNDWLELEGRTLLDKLNEHREPVAEIVSSECEVVQNNQERYFSIACAGAVKPKLGDKLYLHPKVTANKAEVPSDDVIYHALDYIRCGIGCNYSDNDKREELLAKYRDPIANYFKQVKPLPPLKDGEK